MCSSEAVNKVSNLVEDSSYPQLADILLEIRDKAADIKGDIYPGRDPIPMPKLGKLPVLLFKACLKPGGLKKRLKKIINVQDFDISMF